MRIRPQGLDLGAGGPFAGLVQEQGAAVGQLEAAQAPVAAVAEGAGLHACERAAQAPLEDWERALARFAKYVPYRL